VGQPPGLLDDAVDRFCPAVADAAGCEVGQDLLAPAAQSLAESLDLGDRAGVERVEELLGEHAARGLALGVVDRADLLVDATGDLNLAIGVTDRQVLVEPFALPVGEVLVAGLKGAADLVQRVVLVATPVQGLLLDAASDLIERAWPASLTTWKASSTATASGRPS
jgi:hypothetical protein